MKSIKVSNSLADCFSIQKKDICDHDASKANEKYKTFRIKDRKAFPVFVVPRQTAVPFSTCRASLWSSCVVLPLLALTWMSAVLAITDRRSALFQILFAVFDSLEGFVIVMVHCILRREVAHTCAQVTCDRQLGSNVPSD